jgi:lactoylglutathione lyase
VTLTLRSRVRTSIMEVRSMRLGYVIAYVADVDATIEWWERSFGFSRRFVAEDGSYGELDTGATTLSFASHELGKANLPDGFAAHDPASPPAAVEIALVDDDVPAAHARAVEAGARELSAPKQKPWGQTVSYVRDPNGVLIELCSPLP